VKTISETRDLEEEPGHLAESKVIRKTYDLRPRVNGIHDKERWGMLHKSRMNKAFCSCGAIAELDSSAIRLKQKLGKEIECRYCRNRRIAEELEELRAIYGQSDDGWLY